MKIKHSFIDITYCFQFLDCTSACRVDSFWSAWDTIELKSTWKIKKVWKSSFILTENIEFGRNVELRLCFHLIMLKKVKFRKGEVWTPDTLHSVFKGSLPCVSKSQLFLSYVSSDEWLECKIAEMVSNLISRFFSRL